MPISPAPQPTRKRRRLWAFRAGAVLFGVSLFVVAELLCRLIGWGAPSTHDDPFVGFDARQPLFVQDQSGARYEIPPDRLRFFHPESFAVQKGPREFRIFVLGGSTVAGEPYASETSFTTWLELSLRGADTSREWNVINCGGISYASYRLAPILMECLRYQPDLFIISTGHNEFLEDRTYYDWKHAPGALTGPMRSLSRLRIVTLCRTGVEKLRAAPTRMTEARTTATRMATTRSDSPTKWQLPAEVDARLDHAGGLEAYHRDEAWADAIHRHFGDNLRRMVLAAKEGGIPVILVRETSNLADCPPFKSEHRAGLSAGQRGEWEKLIESARSQQHESLPGAIALFRQALRIDGEYALTWYELGKCLETQREYPEARQAFVRARDLDVCPLRVTTPLEKTLREVAASERVPLVDAHDLLERRTARGILGDYWLVDHVHPSVSGHQAIAVALLDELAREGFAHPSAESESRRTKLFEEHLATLPPIYFERGRRTLELLRGWAQGRAEGPPRQQ